MVDYLLPDFSVDTDLNIEPTFEPPDELGVSDGIIEVDLIAENVSDYWNRLFYFKVGTGDIITNYGFYRANFTYNKLYNIRADSLNVVSISISEHTKNSTLEIGLLEQMALDTIGSTNYNFFTNVPELKTSIQNAWENAIAVQKNKLSSGGSITTIPASETESNIYKVVDDLFDTALAAHTDDPLRIPNPLDNPIMNDGSELDDYTPIIFNTGDTISFNITFNSPVDNGRNLIYRYILKVR